jgi:exosortase/archaeosortase family protein
MEIHRAGDGQHQSAFGKIAAFLNSLAGRVTEIVLTIWVLCLLLWGTDKGLAFNAWLDEKWLTFTYHLLGSIGASVVEYNGLLYGPRYQLRIAGTCNGLFLWILLLSACLFWPASFRRRLAALGIGVVLLAVVNCLRLVSVFVLGTHSPRAANFIHDVGWPMLYMLGSLGGVFLLVRADRREAFPSVSAETPAIKGEH